MIRKQFCARKVSIGYNWQNFNHINISPQLSMVIKDFIFGFLNSKGGENKQRKLNKQFRKIIKFIILK